MRASPGTSIDIVPLGSDMARALTAGEVDLVISGLDPDPAVTYERFLFLEGFRCVALPDHPLMAGGSAEPLDVEAFLALAAANNLAHICSSRKFTHKYANIAYSV